LLTVVVPAVVVPAGVDEAVLLEVVLVVVELHPTRILRVKTRQSRSEDNFFIKTILL